MSDKVGIIVHRGRRIVYVDYSHLDSLEVLKERVSRVTEIERNLGGKDILELIDITGSYGDPEIIDFLKESALNSRQSVKKAAVVGISGIKKILLTVVNKFSGQSIEQKESVEEAKDWLALD